MRKSLRNTKGFAVVELIIILVVLVAVGAAGAYAYHRSHNTTKKPSSSNTGKTGSDQTSKNDTPKADPYAGWKQYCDTTYHYCFKYPADWTFDPTVARSSSNPPTSPACAGHRWSTSVSHWRRPFRQPATSRPFPVGSLIQR